MRPWRSNERSQITHGPDPERAEAVATVVTQARTAPAALKWLYSRRCMADIVAAIRRGDELTPDQATRLATIMGSTE